jgi:hypothetical protein
LTGFEPGEYQDIGIFYTVNDLFQGTQLMARTLQCPFYEDPGLWCQGSLQQA